MIILKHFAAQTRLPIKINDIADFILEKGYVDSIVFHPLDAPPEFCAGFVVVRQNMAPYAVGDVADVAYTTRVPLAMQRLICAKELLHICDVDGICARTREQVGSLVKEIGIPLTALVEIAKISPQLSSDHDGLLLAVALLMPKSARKILKQMLDRNLITISEIAALAEVPDPFVAVAMSDPWEMILEKLSST